MHTASYYQSKQFTFHQNCDMTLLVSNAQITGTSNSVSYNIVQT
jgi:hypothetical protein